MVVVDGVPTVKLRVCEKSVVEGDGRLMVG
jgi:hypothetical protein